MADNILGKPIADLEETESVSADDIMLIQDSKKTKKIKIGVILKMIAFSLDKFLSPFQGATKNDSGTSGLVPEPASGDQDSYLRGDGRWVEPIELVRAGVNAVYPVGSIFISATFVDPGSMPGFEDTSWVLFGAGRTLVGVDLDDPDFNSAEKVGGSKTHTLSSDEIPGHSHSIPELTGQTTSKGAHAHQIYYRNDNQLGGNADRIGTSTTNAGTRSTQSGGGHEHDITTEASNTGSTGSGNAHNNLPPYITCYMWKRTE